MQLDAFATGGTSPPRPDLLVSGSGTLYLLFATSPRGETWIDEHVPTTRSGSAAESRLSIGTSETSWRGLSQMAFRCGDGPVTLGTNRQSPCRQRGALAGTG